MDDWSHPRGADAVYRFYLPGMGTDNHLWLEGNEAHHALRVLRVRPGDEVAVFDGSGLECRGIIERVERDRAKIAVAHRLRVDRDPALPVTLACAIVKAKAMDELVEACCELGLRELVPLETRRTVPKVERKEAAHVARWERIAVVASKQSGRTTLTRIAAPRPLPALLEKARQWDLRLVFSPDDEALLLRDALREHERPRSAIILIGPEGGFDPAELRAASVAGFVRVRLGTTVLRTQTAAAAALAAVLAHYDQPPRAEP